MQTAEYINTLGDFLGIRDIPALTQEALQETYQMEQADIFVLFGGSILEGGNILADAIREKVAKKYVIAGGAGHTTETLRQRMHQEFPGLLTEGKTEAEVFADFLLMKYGVSADYLECQSTNCGNNITFLLELIREKQLPCNSIILAQDATMQRRMDAVLKKYVSPYTLVINYAVYQARVAEQDGELAYQNEIWGMWDMERYISLLMGEIPRLTDDENGYGPKGKDFLVHVDIPEKVKTAFEELKKTYAVREANPLFASNLVIRPATEADAEKLCAIYAPYVEKTAVSFEYVPPAPEEFARRIRNTLEKYPYFVAEYDGETAGYIYAGPFHTRAAFARSTEASIYLKSSMHRRGIGRALYQKMEAALQELGMTNLYVSIAVPDKEDEYLTRDSQRFHEKMGFVKVAEFHNCGYKFGRWYHLIYMEKMIGEHL